MRTTDLAPFAASPVEFQVHVFLNLGIWYEPAPTGTLRAALTWASVRSAQASSCGAAFADRGAAAPTMRMATTGKARRAAERIVSLLRCLGGALARTRTGMAPNRRILSPLTRTQFQGKAFSFSKLPPSRVCKPCAISRLSRDFGSTVQSLHARGC